MKCPYCGAENPDNGVFCVQCEKWILAEVRTPAPAPVAAPVEPETATARRVAPSRKTLLATVAAICMVVLCVAFVLPDWILPDPTLSTAPPNLAVNTSSPTSVPTSVPTGAPTSVPFTVPPLIFETPFAGLEDLAVKQTFRGQIVAYEDNGYLAFFSNDSSHITSYSFQQHGDGSLQHSLDGWRCAYISESGLLLYIDENTVRTVTYAAESVSLNTTGSALAYVDKFDGKLYHFDADSGLTTSVYPDADYPIFDSYALSPDGETLAFFLNIPQVSSVRKSYALYRWSYGELTDMQLHYSSDPRILGVANGGQCIYLQEDFTLIAVTAPEMEQNLGDALSTHANGTASVLFNSDQSQMLFRAIPGITKLAELDQITIFHLQELIPINSASISQGDRRNSNFSLMLDVRDGCYAIPSGVDGDPTLVNLYMPSQATTIHGVDQWILSANGQQLFYIDAYGNLYRRDLVSKTTIILTNGKAITNFAINFDGSRVFYVSDQILYTSVTNHHLPTATKIGPIGEQNMLYVTRDGCLYYEEIAKGCLYLIDGQGVQGPILKSYSLNCSVGADGRLYVRMDDALYVSIDFGGLQQINP